MKVAHRPELALLRLNVKSLDFLSLVYWKLQDVSRGISSRDKSMMRALPKTLAQNSGDGPARLSDGALGLCSGQNLAFLNLAC